MTDNDTSGPQGGDAGGGPRGQQPGSAPQWPYGSQPAEASPGSQDGPAPQEAGPQPVAPPPPAYGAVPSAPPQPGQASPYGSAPAHGSAPTYGSAPTSGSAPTYGSASPYGAQPSPYGSASPYGAQGTVAQPLYATPVPLGPDGSVPLWAPHYDAGPVVAVKRFFQKYATFSGRASRAEYWWAVLANSVLWAVLGVGSLLAGTAGSTTYPDGTSDPGPGFYPFVAIFTVLLLGTIVPWLALGVRRLHDVDLSGLLILLNFVPYLGGLVVFILSLLGPKPGGARFDRPTS